MVVTTHSLQVCMQLAAEQLVSLLKRGGHLLLTELLNNKHMTNSLQGVYLFLLTCCRVHTRGMESYTHSGMCCPKV